MEMVDWFVVSSGIGYCTIMSGLRHADGETKSPYYYEDFLGGKDVIPVCEERFTKWWNEINNQRIETPEKISNL